MPAGGGVLAGMLILGVVAAPDRTAGNAEPQMHPGVAHFDARRTSTFRDGAEGHILEIITYVGSGFGHGGEDYSEARGMVTRKVVTPGWDSTSMSPWWRCTTIP